MNSQDYISSFVPGFMVFAISYVHHTAADDLISGRVTDIASEGLKLNHHAMFHTAGELASLGRDHIPTEYSTGSHLIYSSPATLAYQSPGAEGFGVKRAGLSIPGSVMLIVSPGCCARNTSAITEIPGYRNRFFYLEVNETDLVTGRHLKRIPQAARAVVDSLEQKPSLLMICITCVDALLGTDMERVARRAEEACGIPVRPCYMYALTREGTRPPMVQVRESLYSLLQRRSDKTTQQLRAVNILGYFAPLEEDCELLRQLRAIGVEQIRQISTCRDMDDFLSMGDADLNLVLHPEARYSADALAARLGIPWLELTRLYQIDQIEKQYTAMGHALGYEIASPRRKQQALDAVAAVQSVKPDLCCSIGEVMNGNPFELALAMLRYGFRVAEIFANPAPEYYVYIDRIAQLSPDTRIYSNMHPSMLWYQEEKQAVLPDLTIGKDAAWYHPASLHIYWNSDEQPFGYAGVTHLFRDIREAVTLGWDALAHTAVQVTAGAHDQGREEPACSGPIGKQSIKGFRQRLTPFAPDQSGAEAVLYDMGGLITVLDAGGCTGNICGFDEPRWMIQPGCAAADNIGTGRRTALFSAGLRDMDAIMGRDELLMEKLAEAQKEIDAPYAALIGTPVPSVIGTDYHALQHMIERRLKIPVLAIDTNGMEKYDRGEEKAWLALFLTLADTEQSTSDIYRRKRPSGISGRNDALSGADNTACQHPSGRADTAEPHVEDAEEGHPVIGVIGLTLLDVASPEDIAGTRQVLEKQYPGRRIVIYGQGASPEDIRRAGENERNIVVSPAGDRAARYLQQRYGTPFDVVYPAVDQAAYAASKLEPEGTVLILHQQVLANSLREKIRADAARRQGPDNSGAGGTEPAVVCASYFQMLPERMQEGDVQMREEEDLQELLRQRRFTYIFADPAFRQIAGDWDGRWISLPHMAVSGSRFADPEYS